jgi:tetratricopeptide (TPR) repeat protein
MGDLKVRLSDLSGARKDYETALPIYREIQDRLGEANTLQSLANLQRAEGQPEAALQQLQVVLQIHLEIQDRFSAGNDLLYLARTAIAAKQYGLAVLFAEEALLIYRAINYQFGEALIFDDQGGAFDELNEKTGAWAAWWQAREIFRAIQNPSAQRLDETFERLKGNMGAAAFEKLVTDLQAHAEARRQAAVAEVREQAGNDPFYHAIVEALRKGQLSN